MSKNVKIALITGGTVLGVLIILSVVFGAIYGWPYGGWGMMGPEMMGGFGWMWLLPILGIVFVGLIIWAIVASIRGSHGAKGPDYSERDSALEVLKKRYARGEISKEEYEEKRRDLA
jgi:putative membrane protein